MKAEYKGTICYASQGVNSKSEGKKALLVTAHGESWNLYRKNVFNLNDSFFASFDSKEVTVFGEPEVGRNLCVEAIVDNEGNRVEASLNAMKHSQVDFINLQRISKIPSEEISVSAKCHDSVARRLPRKLKKRLKRNVNKS